jgi:hypothetical protein
MDRPRRSLKAALLAGLLALFLPLAAQAQVAGGQNMEGWNNPPGTGGSGGTVTSVGTTATPNYFTLNWSAPTADARVTLASATGLSSNLVLGTFGGSTVTLGSLTLTCFPNLTSACLLIGDGSNRPQIVSPSGDLTLGNTGIFTLSQPLHALIGFNTNGLLCQTSQNNFTARTITGTANKVTVSNGDGVAGAPTLTLPGNIIDSTGATAMYVPVADATSNGYSWGPQTADPPGGTSGQIQYNNFSAFGGFTASGDATIVPSTGVVTVASHAISNGKIRQSAAQSLIGNSTNSTADVADVSPSAGGQVMAANAGGTAIGFTATPQLGVAGTTAGTLALAGVGSGTCTLQTASAAGNLTFTLPATHGSSGDLLSTNGGTPAVLSFVTAPSGTVTSGLSKQMAYYPSNGAVVDGDPNATINAGAMTLGQNASVGGSLELNGPTSGSCSLQTPSVAGSGSTCTFPSGASNPIIADTGASHNFLTAISSGGAISKAQPAFTDISGTATGAQIVSSVALAGSPTTTTQAQGDASTNIATTLYVDTAVAGASPNMAVKVATAGAVLPNSPAYANGTSGLGATLTAGSNTTLTVDGVTSPSSVLVKDQASGVQNGVYDLTTVGGGAPWVLTRRVEMDQASDINNAGAIPVISGTLNASTLWVETAIIVTVGTTGLSYSQFSPSTISAVSHDFLTSYSQATGAFAQAQPAFTDISGTATGAQIPATAAASTIGSSSTTDTQAATDNSTKIATTAYVTTAVANAIAGINPAVSVAAATTATLPNSPTYNNGVGGIGATLTSGTNSVLVLDAYTPTLNQRILDKDETTAANRGVYTVTQLGVNGVAPWILTRALDFDQPSDINSTGAIPVVNGTTNASTSWVQTATIATVGTDALTFAQFSYAPSAVALLASPAFTGTPTAPTAAVATNTTQLATTAFVIANAGSGSGTVASSTSGQVPVYTAATTVTGGANFTASAGDLTLGQSGTKGSITLNGLTSGTCALKVPSVAGTGSTCTFPAGASTSVIADTGAGSNFLTAISTAGAISKAQPAFTDISGSVKAGQMPALTGDITTSAGTVATTLANTAVTAGSYAGPCNMTVDAKGRITKLANGPISAASTFAPCAIYMHPNYLGSVTSYVSSGCTQVLSCGVTPTITANSSGNFNTITAASGTNNAATMAPTNYQMFTAAQLPICAINMMPAASIATERMWMGFFSAAGTTVTSDNPSGTSGMAIRYSTVAGDTNYQLWTCDGSTSQITDTGVAVVALAPALFVFDCSTSGSVKLYNAGTLVATNSTHVPAATTQLGAYATISSQAASTHTFSFGNIVIGNLN